MQFNRRLLNFLTTGELGAVVVEALKQAVEEKVNLEIEQALTNVNLEQMITDGTKRAIEALQTLQTIPEDTDTYIYIGESVVGTLKSAASWRISRVIKSTGETSYADSVTTFTKIWDNRATYNYTIGA